MFILFPFYVTAVDDNIAEDGPYKQNTNIDLKVSCFHSGGVCSGSAGCNITVEYPTPNNTYMVFNGVMTQNLSFYNYTLPNSSKLGKYYTTAYCVDGTYNVSEKYFFYITETGDKSSTLFIYIIELIMKITFFSFLIFISIKGIRKAKDKKKTPYKLVALLRVFWVSLSYAVIFMSPFIGLFLFHPNFQIGVLQTLTLNTYIIMFIVAIPVIIFNLFYFGGQILLELGGLDYDKEKTNKVLNDFSRFTEGMGTQGNKIRNKLFRK